MKRTTNAELLKVAMNYLPSYDLTAKKMAEDYVSCNYGDFMVRFLYRMAYEAGSRIERMPIHEVIDQLEGATSDVANEVHNIISNEHGVLGILSPSCTFLHEMIKLELVKLHFEILYPLLAHHRRNDAVGFEECEHLMLLPCYSDASNEDLFRMSKMLLHNLSGNIVKDIYLDMMADFVKLYQVLDFQTSMEYADFAEYMGNMREESNKDLYDHSQKLWQYKVRHAIGFDAPEEDFEKSLEELRLRFGQLDAGHIVYVVDMFLHSNTGMIDSKFGIQAIQCLDYYLSLRVPMDELKASKRHA